MPMISLILAKSLLISRPLITAVPLVGLRTVARRSRKVVLPAPLGPSIVKISPS